MKPHDSSNFVARLSIAAVLALCGCTVGPRYTPPKANAPDAWPHELGAGMTTRTPDLREWWRQFNDPVLDRLVERALSDSYDMRLAAARVREARALRSASSTDLSPTVNVDASASRQRSSRNSMGGPGGAPGQTSDSFDLGFDASWEVDLFGRVRRSVEASGAELDASYESQRDARVTLVSEVARVYAEMRSLQARLVIAGNNVRTQQETLELAQERLRAGLSSELESAQAQAQLEASRSRIPTLQAALRRAMYRLDVLMGKEPGTHVAELSAESAPLSSPSEIPVGIPADLLRRRPDIRRAERQLAAATARVGVATADLYPRLTLNGSFGLTSSELGDLLETDSHRWSIGPLAVRWPIFDSGRVRALLRAQEARQEQALLAYEQTVLLAYEEVNGALATFARERERRESLANAARAAQRAVDLADELWRRGLSDFLNVLDTQRALFDLEDQLAQSEQATASSLIALYKALGGGWPDRPMTGGMTSSHE